MGSIGDLAHTLAHGTEVPPEFYFASGLTILGGLCAGRLKLAIGFESEPRLYTVLLGESYGVKKSTAAKKTMEFFNTFTVLPSLDFIHGVGSVEGLARKLTESPDLFILFDELKSFVQKSKVENSLLLPMMASLFEGHSTY